jgi:methanogenic corrinoid protein MtbC1
MASELTMAMADLEEEKVQGLVKAGLAAGVSPNQLLEECREGMTLIGKRFESGEYFLSDLIMAGEIFKTAAAELTAHGGSGGPTKGKVVLGTVKGDIHDIGKDIVVTMLRGANYEVTDLGVDVPAERFVEAAVERKADLVCLSALLTTTMGQMKTVVDRFAEAGIRGRFKIIVGGAPITDAFRASIGADSYAPDAASAADTALGLLAPAGG